MLDQYLLWLNFFLSFLITSKVHFKTNLSSYKAQLRSFLLYTLLVRFCFTTTEKLKRCIRNIFWLIFVDNTDTNKNNRSTCKEAFYYKLRKFIWIPFKFWWIQENWIRTLSLIGINRWEMGWFLKKVIC